MGHCTIQKLETLEKEIGRSEASLAAAMICQNRTEMTCLLSHLEKLKKSPLALGGQSSVVIAATMCQSG